MRFEKQQKALNRCSVVKKTDMEMILSTRLKMAAMMALLKGNVKRKSVVFE